PPRAIAAAVIGARHLRSGRNGQDAAAAWAGGDAGAIVVCDGCSAGRSSEVGARLGAELVIAAASRALSRGAPPGELWPEVHGHVVRALGALVDAMPGDRATAVHDHLLFTVVAAAWRADRVAVWAVGDGAYQLGDRARVLGPFADNQPPYLGYELLGLPAAAHLEIADAGCGVVTVATDGAAEVGLDAFGDRARYFARPDALRRQLAVLARGDDRIDWDARRLDRRPAALQDDGAVAILEWAR
ncbi:MAG: protein phosphatase 2C domain-containing protein, partial [Kofleriaceae bacterium]